MEVEYNLNELAEKDENEIEISKTFDFVPKWNGNDKNPDPIVFEMRYLSIEELDNCFGNSALQKPALAFVRSVMLIKNLILKDPKTGQKKEINNPFDFIKLSSDMKDVRGVPSLNVLYAQVVKKIIGMSPREMEIKN